MGFTSAILFSQFTFERLAPAVLTLVIFIFFISRRGKDRSQLYLALFFVAAFLYETGHIATYSLYSPPGAYGWYMTALAPFGLVFLIQFAYCFSSSVFSREAKFVFIISLLLSFISFIEYIINAAGAEIIFTESGYAPDYVSQLIPVFCLLFYFWMIVVFIRNILHGAKHSKNIFILIMRPDTVSGRISRDFAFLVILDLVKTIMIISHVFFASLPYVTVISIQNGISLVVYSLYAVVFIRGDLKRLSLRFKIVGSILIINLMVFSTMGHLVMSQFESSYNEKRLAELRYIPRQIANGDFSSMPGDCDYVVNFSLNKYEWIFTREEKLKQIDRITLNDFTPGQWRLSTDEQGISPDAAQTMKRYHARMNDTNSNIYIITAAGERYGIGYNYHRYRIAASSPAGILILILFFTTLIILLAVPRIISRLLARSDTDSHASFSAAGKTVEHETDTVHNQSSTDEKPEDREYVVTAEAQRKVEDAIKYIAANYMQELTREGIADTVGFSPGRFGRAFKTCTGKKVGEYINDVRIEKARELLAGNEAVINIAYSVGFESLSTFSRAFHKNYRKTPTTYREELQRNNSRG